VFYAYRYFLVHNGQLSFLSVNEKVAINTGKVNYISEMVKKCEQNKKIDLEIEGKRYLLLLSRKVNDQTFIFKFCRDIPISRYKYDEKNAEVTLSKEQSYPFVFLIIDVKRQIILLENRTAVFQKIEICKNFL